MGLTKETLRVRGMHCANCENIVEHYGADALQKYGVGTYRRYGLLDASTLFGELFAVEHEKGFDGITHSYEFVFLLSKAT